MALVAFPLCSLPDPEEAGGDATMLATLASQSNLPIVPSLVVRLAATADLAAGASSTTDAVGAIERAWRAIGCPTWVTIRSGAVGAAAASQPFAPPPSARRRIASATELLDAVHAAARFSSMTPGSTTPGSATPGSAEDGGSVTVLVQSAPVARVRGSAYSEDPREDRVEHLHIDAWTGDAASPGSPAVHYRLARAGGRIATRAEPEAHLVLSTVTLREIFSVLRQAEGVLADAIALEWAWGDGGVWITHAGPITSPLPWGVHRDRPHPHDSWTRANAGEVFPNLVTPLTWSLTAGPLDQGFRALYHKPDWTAGRRFVALCDSYLYFNFGLIYSLNVERLGAPARQTVAPVGGPGIAEGLRMSERGLNPPAVVRNLPLLLRIMRRQRRLPGEWPDKQRWLEDEQRRLAALPLESLSVRQLLDALLASQARLDGFFDFLMEAQGAAFSTFTILSYLLERFLHDDGLAAALLQGLSGVRTAEANLALWRLAERARDDSRVAATIRDTPPNRLLAALQADRATAWLAAELDAYLAEYGHRSAGELELMEPRWAEDPTPLLRTFRGYLSSPHQISVDDLSERQVRRRLEVEREIDRRLTAHWWERILPLRRALVRSFRRWAQRYTPLRENPKFYLLRVVQEQRRILLQLADRLVEAGSIADPSDLFFLLQEELHPLVRCPADALLVARLRSRARRRRVQYALAQARTPPDVLGAPPARTEPPTAAPAVLRGLGASPGCAEGRARVATNPEEGGALVAGEVLVAKFTDPGWAPLFPLAAAVVTEIGGVLSHGAIVAREHGIPAVVNVRDATRRIRPGQRLRVDGGSGTVALLPEDA